MFNIFRKSSLLKEESQHFQVECFKWLLTHFGGDDFYQEAELVLPTENFFPVKDSVQGLTAESVFEEVKKHAGLEEWPVTLEAQEEDPNHLVTPTLIIQNVDHNPLGTFSANNKNEFTITYNPSIESDPTQMVATFAHELSHYLTTTSPVPPPGGWENWECATDICATFLGFGIFMANSAFNFRQFSTDQTIGWETSGGGYLSEAEHSYALALFLLLKDIPAKAALPFCDTNIKSYLKRALKELESSQVISELKAVQFIPPSS